MTKGPKLLVQSGVLAVLLCFNLALVSGNVAAHNWWSWHWDKSTLGVYVYGPSTAESRQAIYDWHSMTDLSLPERTSHTDVSVFAGNYGDTGWGGLASIESYSWDWHCWWWCKITHAHARYNSYYGGSSWWIRGVQCQEVGHTFGLDHNNRGGCMGLGYYAGSSNRPSSHDVSDVNAKY